MFLRDMWILEKINDYIGKTWHLFLCATCILYAVLTLVFYGISKTDPKPEDIHDALIAYDYGVKYLHASSPVRDKDKAQAYFQRSIDLGYGCAYAGIVETMWEERKAPDEYQELENLAMKAVHDLNCAHGFYVLAALKDDRKNPNADKEKTIEYALHAARRDYVPAMNLVYGKRNIPEREVWRQRYLDEYADPFLYPIWPNPEYHYLGWWHVQWKKLLGDH